MSRTRQIIDKLEQRSGDLTASVPRTMRGRLGWEAIKRSVALAIERNEKLAACDVRTIYGSLLFLLSLGLDPSGLTGQAYLIPRGRECQPMVGVRGMLELAYRSGEVVRIVSGVVHRNDDHDHNLADGTMRHRLNFDVDDRGAPLFAYARIWLAGSDDPILEIMPWPEVMRAKAAGGGRSPAWRDWPDEMARKTVLKRALKRAPASPELQEAISAEAVQDMRGRMERAPEPEARPTGRTALGLPDRQAARDVEQAELDAMAKTPERVVVDAEVREAPAQAKAPPASDHPFAPGNGNDDYSDDPFAD